MIKYFMSLKGIQRVRLVICMVLLVIPVILLSIIDDLGDYARRCKDCLGFHIESWVHHD